MEGSTTRRQASRPDDGIVCSLRKRKANTQAATKVGGDSDITLQGNKIAVTLYKPGEEFSYYERGDAVTVGLFYAGTTGKLLGKSAGTLYKGNGTAVRQIGDSHTRYKKGSGVKKQGTPYYGKLYDADGALISDTLYLGDGGTVYPAVEGATYYDKGDYVYPRGDTVTNAYYAGSTVALQGDEFESTVFLSGGKKTVTIQGDAYGSDVYGPGTKYSGDEMYVGFKPATFTTKEVTALTT